MSSYKKNKNDIERINNKYDIDIITIKEKILALDKDDLKLFDIVIKSSFTKSKSQKFLQKLGAYSINGELLAPYKTKGE